MQSVRTLGVRELEGASKLLFGQKRSDVFQRCLQMKWVDRRQTDNIEVCFRASKADKKRIVEVETRTHPSV